ncbi:hypothetical protein IV203_035825 [Nitzschia inconspicua]|uniref:Uncharacterized protein n=1 Tax=Nitzschia inconspicua TaxID=303405 RepID=A0A9K3LGY1_9STRA|nr:hypothetical protein IV203_035825 [Nitzschia inconspicua]
MSDGSNGVRTEREEDWSKLMRWKDCTKPQKGGHSDEESTEIKGKANGDTEQRTEHGARSNEPNKSEAKNGSNANGDRLETGPTLERRNTS